MQDFRLESLQPGSHIHFVGIGGISMSGLAEILKKSGFLVSGSDLKESPITQKLIEMGVLFTQGHAKENVNGADLIVYTAAVKNDNPEIQAAAKQNIPSIERAVLLGDMMRRYRYPIAVAGTHGKTTTTSMVSLILMQAALDPTIMVGGELDAIGGNVLAGGSTYFVTEACEYVESFLKFYPYTGIILNVEADHLDYFRDLNHIIESFSKFSRLIPKDGSLIVCGEDKNAMTAVKDMECNIVTYGVKDSNMDWIAKNVHFNRFGHPEYDILYKGSKLSTIQLNVPGIHNVYNSLAAAACAHTFGVSINNIAVGLNNFKGTHRRFEIKGDINGYTIVDDYAHHPTEIMATLEAASKIPHNKIRCIFQPHTYTRTYSLLEDFSKAFGNADEVIIADIYAAREKDDGRIHSSVLAERINSAGKKAFYLSSFADIASFIKSNATDGDIILTMGAGNIDQVGNLILGTK